MCVNGEVMGIQPRGKGRSGLSGEGEAVCMTSSAEIRLMWSRDELNMESR